MFYRWEEMVRKGEHVLPFWRLYLLTRNSIVMGLESDAKLKILWMTLFRRYSLGCCLV